MPPLFCFELPAPAAYEDAASDEETCDSADEELDGELETAEESARQAELDERLPVLDKSPLEAALEIPGPLPAHEVRASTIVTAAAENIIELPFLNKFITFQSNYVLKSGGL